MCHAHPPDTVVPHPSGMERLPDEMLEVLQSKGEKGLQRLLIRKYKAEHKIR